MKAVYGGKKTVYYKYTNIPNVQFVGNPTVNNGVVSGFSASNYCILPKHFLDAQKTANTWEMQFKFTPTAIPSSSDTRRRIIFHSGTNSTSSDRNGVVIDLYQTNLRIIYSDVSSPPVINLSPKPVANTTYWIKLTFDYNALTFGAYYKTNASDDWTTTGTVTVGDRIFSTDLANQTEIGNATYNTDYYFNDSIDLNECYINIDGQRWWNGTTAIVSDSADYDFTKQEDLFELPVINGNYYGVKTYEKGQVLST